MYQRKQKDNYVNKNAHLFCNVTGMGIELRKLVQESFFPESFVTTTNLWQIDHLQRFVPEKRGRYTPVRFLHIRMLFYRKDEAIGYEDPDLFDLRNKRGKENE